MMIPNYRSVVNIRASVRLEQDTADGRFSPSGYEVNLFRSGNPFRTNRKKYALGGWLVFIEAAYSVQRLRPLDLLLLSDYATFHAS